MSNFKKYGLKDLPRLFVKRDKLVNIRIAEDVKLEQITEAFGAPEGKTGQTWVFAFNDKPMKIEGHILTLYNSDQNAGRSAIRHLMGEKFDAPRKKAPLNLFETPVSKPEMLEEAASKKKTKEASPVAPGKKRNKILVDIKRDDLIKETEDDRSNSIIESFEQLDELSKKTLADYVNKSSKDLALRSGKRASNQEASYQYDRRGMKAIADKTKELANKENKPISNRFQGIRKATTRLAKEDVNRIIEEFEQLDELSKKTLGNYIKKAKGKLAFTAHEFGKNANDGAEKNNKRLDDIEKRHRYINKAVDKLTKEDLDASNIADDILQNCSEDQIQEAIEFYTELAEKSSIEENQQFFTEIVELLTTN